MASKQEREPFERDAVSEELETLFGKAYLDYPDTSGNVPQGLKEAAEAIGHKIFDATELVGRALEIAPEIPCLENQRILAHHLRGFIGDEPSGIEWEDMWATQKHMVSCGDPSCREFMQAAALDHRLAPEQMKFCYGKIIDEWFEKHQKEE